MRQGTYHTKFHALDMIRVGCKGGWAINRTHSLYLEETCTHLHKENHRIRKNGGDPLIFESVGAIFESVVAIIESVVAIIEFVVVII